MLCCVLMVTSLCDLVKTVVDWLKDSDNVPYQLISPIILLITVVSVCVVRVCVCLCVVRVHVHVRALVW